MIYKLNGGLLLKEAGGNELQIPKLIEREVIMNAYEGRVITLHPKRLDVLKQYNCKLHFVEAFFNVVFPC